MSNKAKKYTLSCIIYGVVFVIYTLLVMLIFPDKNNVFWACFAFMFIGFAINVGVMFYTFKSGDVEAAFFGIPLISFSIFYFFAELFVSLVFMIFRNKVSIVLPVVVQVILLLIFVLFAALALLARTTVVEKTEDIKAKVSSVKNLSIDVKVLEDACMDPQLKNALHKVTEAIRFADPMTNDSVADLDNVIRGKVSELKMYCGANNKDAAMQICNQLVSFISERNMRLMQSK